MTEAEWFITRDVTVLLSLHSEGMSERKLRMFACQCLRGLGDALPFESRECIKYVEKYLDGLLGWNDVVNRVNARTIPYWLDTMATPAQVITRGLPALLVSDANTAADDCTFWCELFMQRGPNWRMWPMLVSRGAFYREDSIDTSRFLPLLHDIFGNPFRPVAFNPVWRTSTTVGLAQTMYAARDFAAIPIFADALQDAGCEDDAILTHCRGDGPHVRGCWVVDLVLGKT